MVDVRKDIMTDDPNLGGSRQVGTASMDVEGDSALFMAAFGWFAALCKDVEPMPNSDLHEIDAAEYNEIYDEFKRDIMSMGAPTRATLSAPPYIRIPGLSSDYGRAKHAALTKTR